MKTMHAGTGEAAGGGVGLRRLGRTELQVSEVGLGGAWLLGRRGEGDLAAGAEIVCRALELGVNYIDTAECYIGGRSERVVGEGLRQGQGAREGCTVATKFGHVPKAFDFRARSVLESLQRSLEALGLARLDVFQLHTPAEPAWDLLAGPDGAFEGLRQAKARGLVRFLGITGRDVDFLVRCIETDLFDTALIFTRFNAVEQSAEPFFRAAAEHDVGVIVAGPLYGGLLGSARDERMSRAASAVQSRVRTLEALALAAGISLPEMALRFILSHRAAACTLCGSADISELEGSIAAAARGPLPAALVEAIRGLR